MIVQYEYKETLLKLENICLEYDGRPILKGVNAEIKDIFIPNRVTGQIVGFLGPSGIGKTQLFRIIAGLNKPTSGQVLLADDTDKGFHSVVTGEVGVVAQDYPLFEHRTVMGNLMLPALAHEKSEKIAKESVLDYLDKFKLLDKAKLYPCQLSGGQRQRVAILQMLICRERFILMDEPFSGLDLIMLEKTCETLTEAANLHEENTVIVVTHDVTAAVTIADHIWLLGRDRDEKGEIIPGARIVETYDLLERGLCYEPEMITSNHIFTDTVREIKSRFRTL
jgi:ABC-type nitrate/sulfonate/bicarbonate transport system ATPase subunit